MSLHRSGGDSMMTRGALPVGLVGWCLVAMLGCDFGQAPSESGLRPAGPPYVEQGDLPQLKSRGRLRVLMPRREQFSHLPRKGFPFALERELIVSFAHSVGLTPVLVTVDAHDELVPALLEGKGDVIAANFTVTPERKKQIAFSVPVAMVREQLVTRADDHRLKKPADLAGRRIAVRRSSSFWGTAKALRAKHASLKLDAAPEHLDTEQILDRVARSEFDVTVADDNLMGSVLAYRSDLRPAFDLTPERPAAFGVRPDADALLDALNRFLNEAKLIRRRPPVYSEDLPGIRKHGVLRVLTRNNPATYFLWRGELLGFEYELIRKFAEQHGLRVEMVVPPGRDDLIPWLKEGRGDVVAASLTITAEREEQGIHFSRPYHSVSEILVARADEKETALAKPADLEGRTVAVRRSSSYWNTLERLRQSGIALEIDTVPEELETEEIIAKVAAGDYDLTVADSHILDIELTWRDDIRAAFPLGDSVSHGWAVREDDTQLLTAITSFLKKEYRGLFYNITYKKYFKNARTIRKHVEFRASRTGELSPYDDLVRRYAEQYGFDWRLVVAQMYQESRFDPGARSWAGAVGLMQVLPRTAKSMGFADVSEPEEGIHAGVKYLDWVRKRFGTELPVEDRTWFTLAAYNVGYGHVLDARRLARKLRLNPDRWFNNVEKAMLLLARRQYARQARHGYCRGSEPVKYVRSIRNRYEAYTQVDPDGERDRVERLIFVSRKAS